MIRIVDQIMGKGKTSAAHKYINDHSTEHFLYVTPFTDECDRAKAACPCANFCIPSDNGFPSKSAHLQYLMKQGANVALTHALFQLLTEDCTKWIQTWNYTLILDEELEVVEDTKISVRDQKILMEQNLISIDPKTKQLSWSENSYEGEFNEIKRQIQRHSLFQSATNIILWIFPAAILAAFKTVFVLTFMFRGSILYAYCRHFDIQFEYWHIECNEFTPGFEDVSPKEKAYYRELITVYSGKLNDIGDSSSALSKQWYTKRGCKAARKQLRNHTYNYFRNITKVPSNAAMWSTFKNYIPDLERDCMMTNHVPCNCRATNKYDNKAVLAYLVNVFPSPPIKNYLSFDGHFNDDYYALSQLLQWIWRSRIRKGESIQLYIPSRRMRQILLNWLAN